MFGRAYLNKLEGSKGGDGGAQTVLLGVYMLTFLFYAHKPEIEPGFYRAPESEGPQRPRGRKDLLPYQPQVWSGQHHPQLLTYAKQT